MKIQGWVTGVNAVTFTRDGEDISIAQIDIEGLRLLVERRAGDPQAWLNREISALVVVKWSRRDGRSRPVLWVRAVNVL